METGIATQLITAGSTLTAVVLTLLTNAFLEHRRARDARRLETLRMTSERAKWLRDERQNSYASLSIAGEKVQQFFRYELLTLSEPGREAQRDETEAYWRELCTELRKAYNQVALLGADEARAAGLSIWRTARNGGNDFFRSLHIPPTDSIGKLDLSNEIKTVASELGAVGNSFLEACRKDLQGESDETID
ncbi:MAG: hypothetical protein JO272_17200 [Pseudonocardiales bacterium]|nr:hypothetical protein [Pseudonocardiales bacterium]